MCVCVYVAVFVLRLSGDVLQSVGEGERCRRSWLRAPPAAGPRADVREREALGAVRVHGGPPLPSVSGLFFLFFLGVLPL